MDPLIMLIAFGLLIGALSFPPRLSSSDCGGLLCFSGKFIAGQAFGFSVIVRCKSSFSVAFISLCLWHDVLTIRH
ncbi:hypothetical protein O9929_03560 [Vibrio lentus]|nr:hypothetical protein [Vibrio lentus]